MTIFPSGRLVTLGGVAVTGCIIRVQQITSQELRVSAMACCVKEIDPCIAQGAAKTFTFTDAASVDYSTATEITFDVWDKRPGQAGAASLYSGSLTGGQITQPTDYQFRLTIDGTESVALAAGRHWCEAWVTTSGGDPLLVGAGVFKVIDTRKQD